jgi:hypothetical protein
MTLPSLPKAYDFKLVEHRIYQMWEQQGFFKPTNDPNQPGFDPGRKPFVISDLHPTLQASFTWDMPCLSPWKI